MRESAVVSHLKNKKHMEKIDNRNSISALFFKNFADLNRDAIAKPSIEIACNSNHKLCKITTNLTSKVLKSAITKADILLCLNSVLSQSSFRSCQSTSNLFGIMFSDNGAAKSFSLEKQNVHIL